jgi:hypothetical protein
MREVEPGCSDTSTLPMEQCRSQSDRIEWRRVGRRCKTRSLSLLFSHGAAAMQCAACSESETFRRGGRRNGRREDAGRCRTSPPHRSICAIKEEADQAVGLSHGIWQERCD